jgi:hypothetical protein
LRPTTERRAARATRGSATALHCSAAAFRFIGGTSSWAPSAYRATAPIRAI